MKAQVPKVGHDTVFVNELRLTGRQWLLVGGIVLAFMLLAPRVWRQAERFDTGPDYRQPYALSKDYWLYERRLGELPAKSAVLIGDSVVWGEYVLPDGTLSHFLNQEAGATNLFVNAGIPIGNFELYAFGSYSRRNGRSAANYRQSSSANNRDFFSFIKSSIACGA